MTFKFRNHGRGLSDFAVSQLRTQSVKAPHDFCFASSFLLTHTDWNCVFSWENPNIGKIQICTKKVCQIKA